MRPWYSWCVRRFESPEEQVRFLQVAPKIHVAVAQLVEHQIVNLVRVSSTLTSHPKYLGRGQRACRLQNAWTEFDSLTGCQNSMYRKLCWRSPGS